jgi:DNA-binding CsgD family transcriptional regulator
MSATARLWFDPRCPWAWIASRWLLELQRVRPVQVRFGVMSLSVLNEHRTDGDFPARNTAGRGPVRVAVAAEQEYGNDALGRLYTALGSRIHLAAQPLGRPLYEAALTEAGLPETLAAAAEDTTHDTAVRASHDTALRPVGTDVGTPIIHVDRGGGDIIAFAGPVVSPAPRGEAGELAAAAAGFEALGAMLLAVEACAGAAEAYTRAGDRRAAAQAMRRASVLAAVCEGADTPGLVHPAGAVPLSGREREIVMLAASGLASKDIAGRLYLSVRTVNNHLQHAYAKLGVSSRAGLAEALRIGS